MSENKTLALGKYHSDETVKEMVAAMIRSASSSRPHNITPEEILRIAKLYIEFDA